MLVRTRGKENTCSLLVGAQTYTTTMVISTAVPQNLELDLP